MLSYKSEKLDFNIDDAVVIRSNNFDCPVQGEHGRIVAVLPYHDSISEKFQLSFAMSLCLLLNNTKIF